MVDIGKIPRLSSRLVVYIALYNTPAYLDIMYVESVKSVGRSNEFSIYNISYAGDIISDIVIFGRIEQLNVFMLTS